MGPRTQDEIIALMDTVSARMEGVTGIDEELSRFRDDPRGEPDWAEGKLIGFDIESTGVKPDTARIVTASLVRCTPGEAPISQDWLVAVEEDIPPEATKIHGITNEHAREHGRPVREVVSEIIDGLISAWNRGLPVVIYNAPYDLTVLRCEVARHLDGLGMHFFSDAGKFVSILDPLVIDKHCHRYRKGSRKLGDTCEFYGIPLTQAHTSSADAVAAVRLMWELVHRYPELGMMPLPELHGAQAGWYREQQRSFATYLRTRVAQGVLGEAIVMTGEDRTMKLADLRDVLDRADAVAADTGGWPVRWPPC